MELSDQMIDLAVIQCLKEDVYRHLTVFPDLKLVGALLQVLEYYMGYHEYEDFVSSIETRFLV